MVKRHCFADVVFKSKKRHFFVDRVSTTVLHVLHHVPAYLLHIRSLWHPSVPYYVVHGVAQLQLRGECFHLELERVHVVLGQVYGHHLTLSSILFLQLAMTKSKSS